MRKALALLVTLVLTGCSTAPVADFLDHFWPGRLPATAGAASGGVCIPQGALPGAGTVITGPPAAVTTPNPSILAAPFPLPGANPAPAGPPAGLPAPPAGVLPAPPAGALPPPPDIAAPAPTPMGNHGPIPFPSPPGM